VKAVVDVNDGQRGFSAFHHGDHIIRVFHQIRLNAANREGFGNNLPPNCIGGLYDDICFHDTR